jgi:hypothetical protein
VRAATRVDNRARNAEIAAALTKEGSKAQAVLGDLLGMSARRPAIEETGRKIEVRRLASAFFGTSSASACNVDAIGDDKNRQDECEADSGPNAEAEAFEALKKSPSEHLQHRYQR